MISVLTDTGQLDDRGKSWPPVTTRPEKAPLFEEKRIMDIIDCAVDGKEAPATGS